MPPPFAIFTLSDHRIARRHTDICRPFRVVLDRIRGKPKNLDVALVEFRLDPRHVAKSLGWGNNTAHSSLIQAWKRIFPLASASKSGAVSPMCKAIMNLYRLRTSIA